MKTAIYIEDSILQVVLTPETDEEKAVLSLVEKKEIVEIYRGSFYSCKGGWVRQRDFPTQYGNHWKDNSDSSLIFILKQAEVKDGEVS